MSVIKVTQGKLLKWENLLLNNTCFIFFCICTGVRKCHFHLHKTIWNIMSILAIEIILKPNADSNVCLPITHLCDVNSLYLLRFSFLSSPLGTDYNWLLRGWSEKVLLRCLTPWLSESRQSVRCFQWWIRLLVGSQYRAHTLKGRSTVCSWNVYHLCWVRIWKTWSLSCEAEHKLGTILCQKWGEKY